MESELLGFLQCMHKVIASVRVVDNNFRKKKTILATFLCARDILGKEEIEFRVY